MTKNVGLTYVKEFEFPAEQGFTGSAGVHKVRGYMRGGHVKQKDPVKAAAQKPRAPGPGAAKGGKMEYAEGGTVGVTTKRGPKSKRPKDTMTKAAGGGSIHDKLYNEGGKMGYMRGGHVKDTSSEFVEKSGPQDAMDHGTYAKGAYANEAEKEAGGRKKLLPAFKHGGGVHKTHHARRKASKKGMPKNVKAKGGLAKYAEGGNISVEDVPGSGAARRNMGKLKDRERRVRSTVDEAIRAGRASQQGGARPKPTVHDKPAPARKKSIHKTMGASGEPSFSHAGPAGTKYKKARGGPVGKRGAAR